MTSGDKIKKLRKEKGLTQGKLAELADVHAVSISKWENNKETPERASLEKIAPILGVSAAYLLEDDSTPSDTPITLSQLARDWAAKYTRLPGGLFSLKAKNNRNNLVFVPRVPAEYTAHCGGVGVTYGDITSCGPEDYEVVVEHKLGPIDPFRPPFALCTDGSSMVDFGIPPNAVVVVNPAAEVGAGSLVLVEINGNPVIKKIYPRPDGGGKLASSDGREISYTQEDLDIEYVKVRGKIVKADLELDHRP